MRGHRTNWPSNQPQSCRSLGNRTVPWTIITSENKTKNNDWISPTTLQTNDILSIFTQPTLIVTCLLHSLWTAQHSTGQFVGWRQHGFGSQVFCVSCICGSDPWKGGIALSTSHSPNEQLNGRWLPQLKRLAEQVVTIPCGGCIPLKYISIYIYYPIQTISAVSHWHSWWPLSSGAAGSQPQLGQVRVRRSGSDLTPPVVLELQAGPGAPVLVSWGYITSASIQ